MLSRTAEGLFWLGRYIERADNVARFVEAGRRFDAMSGASGDDGNEWEAVLIAAGSRQTFPGDITKATAEDAIPFMVADPDNPSSVQSCFAMARANARAQRGAISSDAWEAVNTAWRAAQNITPLECTPRYLARTLERMRTFTSLFRGALAATMLRDESLTFLRLGQFVERADATARLLDVKYHVLLPDDHPVGSAKDQLQWNTLLRAAGARSAYRWVYRKPVEHRLVIDLLLLNKRSPRSYQFCMNEVCAYLTTLHAGGSASQSSLALANEMRESLQADDVDAIVAHGLHEYLTNRIVGCNRLAAAISADFGFAPILAADVQVQTT